MEKNPDVTAGIFYSLSPEIKLQFLVSSCNNFPGREPLPVK